VNAYCLQCLLTWRGGSVQLENNQEINNSTFSSSGVVALVVGGAIGSARVPQECKTRRRA